MAGGGGGGGEYDVQLNLVPLIDILTNILFFLLVGFASTELKYEGKLELPSAAVNLDPKTAVTIQLATNELQVEQLVIARIGPDGKLDAPMEGDKIVPLYEKLNAIRSGRKETTGGIAESDDVIWLLADRKVPFKTLSPVMKTAAMAGFPNFRFAVVKK